jgi:hypothetical protein
MTDASSLTRCRPSSTYPNVGAAYRIDGGKGSGTLKDPYDGSTAARLDGILSTRLKMVREVCGECATANPTEVIVAETNQGRAILGVVDGAKPQGIEADADIAWRKGLLRHIGYKA